MRMAHTVCGHGVDRGEEEASVICFQPIRRERERSFAQVRGKPTQGGMMTDPCWSSGFLISPSVHNGSSFNGSGRISCGESEC
jgi:hypothetical protein